MKFSSILPRVFSSRKGTERTGKWKHFSVSTSTIKSSKDILSSAFVILIAFTATCCIVALPTAQAFNDEKGILKWNPYWFSNFRYSAPSSFYISPNRVGTPYKRMSEPTGFSGLGSIGSSGGSMYKWSPVYFSGGSNTGIQQPSSFYYNNGGTMYSSSRPLWTANDYGGSRFLTRYYGGNTFIPSAVPRSVSSVGSSGSVIDLAGSNDLSALLGDEMNGGLGLDNDAIDVLDGEGIASQKQRSH